MIDYLSTEQSHSLTENLSQVFEENSQTALELLHEVDLSVEKGLGFFIETHLPSLKPVIQKCTGRIILVGAGSSGRIAYDLAAKARNKKIAPVMAGGLRAFVKPEEGAEDQSKQGTKALSDLDINAQDVVILISASGSSKFNVGAGQEAVKRHAQTFYFYNSTRVPPYTEELFEQGVKPLLIDCGPQAIRGSTRLQAATLASACLGALFLEAEEPVQTLQAANKDISAVLPDLERLVQQGISTLKDQGYITFIASSNALRETLIDVSETPPTFSTNPPRSTGEKDLPPAEFRAYLLNSTDNQVAWNTIGTGSVGDIILGDSVSGHGSYQDRPKNLVIGVLKDDQDKKALMAQLKAAQAQGATIALISIGGGSEGLSYEVCLPFSYDSLASSLVLKQILNLFSNGVMLGLQKVYGNHMIDVNPSNDKLVERAARLLQELHQDPLSLEEATNLILKTKQERQSQAQKGVFLPPIIRLCLEQLRVTFSSH